MTSRRLPALRSEGRRAGILAAFAITLTGLSARAEEPTFTPLPAASVAAPAASSSPMPWLAQPSAAAVFTSAESGSSPSRMMWLVLPALALGGAALYMRLAKQRGGSGATPRRLEVWDTARVGPKAHVVMISVGGRKLLLGVTEQSVQRLAWIEPEGAASSTEFEPQASEPALREGPFAHLLKSFTEGKHTANAGSDAALTIAAETRDVIERRSAPLSDAERADVRPANLIKVTAQDGRDIEGQVSGLRKRRAGKHG